MRTVLSTTALLIAIILIYTADAGTVAVDAEHCAAAGPNIAVASVAASVPTCDAVPR